MFDAAHNATTDLDGRQRVSLNPAEDRSNQSSTKEEKEIEFRIESFGKGIHKAIGLFGSRTESWDHHTKTIEVTGMDCSIPTYQTPC